MEHDICSTWAYHEILESGKIGRLHGMYLSVYSESIEPLTAHQAILAFRDKFKDFPYKSHHGMGSRISELTDMGFLRKFDIVKCTYTGQRVNRWKYTGRKEPKKKTIVQSCCPRCSGSGKIDKTIYED